MPGGFLRVKYPEPEMCLDLDTWQEFFGFDLTGVTADLSIEVNSDDLTMTITAAEQLPEVAADGKVKTDYFANPVTAETRIAGPFAEIGKGTIVVNIDPRRINKEG